MTELPFIKMHGAGNDYVFIDGFETSLPSNSAELSRRISDRHFGVGSDGLVLLVPPRDDSTDVEMRMWNADGSEGAMCGNAARCIALWMQRQRRVTAVCRIGTVSGTVLAEVLQPERHENAADVRIELRSPRFPTDTEQVLEDVTLPGTADRCVRFTAVSVGNPHAVIFVDELSDRDVRHLGSIISQHPRFPGGINVEWVRVVSPEELEVRVWERGSGETLACGSGACAAAAAAIRAGYCLRDAAIKVVLPGGRLTVCWKDSGNGGYDVLELVGPAEVSFRGLWQN